MGKLLVVIILGTALMGILLGTVLVSLIEWVWKMKPTRSRVRARLDFIGKQIGTTNRALPGDLLRHGMPEGIRIKAQKAIPYRVRR